MTFFARCCLLVLAASLLMVARANAVTEFCPGTVSTFIPIHSATVSKDLGTDKEFEFKLGAETGRTIDATLAVYAGGDLYELTLKDVLLSEHLETEKLSAYGGNVFTQVRTVFESAPLYLSFAASTRVEAAWVSAAAQRGTSTKPCPTMPFTTQLDPQHSGRPSEVPDAAARASASSKPQMKLTAHVDPGSCATKFVPVKLQRAVSPEYPSQAAQLNLGHRIAAARVALDNSGKTLDAWIIGTSGNADLDNATLYAANASTYSPPQFLCVAIPSFFQFNANFDLSR